MTAAGAGMVLPVPFPESPTPVRELPQRLSRRRGLLQSLVIVLAVGTVLGIINQTPAILAGRKPPEIAVRIAANCAVPFIVATTSRLWAQRSVLG